MGRWLRALLAVTAAAVLAPGAAPALARAAPAEGQVAGQQARAVAVCGESHTYWGYTGTLKCDTTALRCDWDRDGFYEEVFGVAPSGTIWHVWPNSGGWREMPNNGSAADTWRCYYNGYGQRQVEVVTSARYVWYSYYSGGWRGWYRH